jgi:hypothetical protein
VEKIELNFFLPAEQNVSGVLTLIEPVALNRDYFKIGFFGT